MPRSCARKSTPPPNPRRQLRPMQLMALLLMELLLFMRLLHTTAAAPPNRCPPPSSTTVFAIAAMAGLAPKNKLFSPSLAPSAVLQTTPPPPIQLSLPNCFCLQRRAPSAAIPPPLPPHRNLLLSPPLPSPLLLLHRTLRRHARPAPLRPPPTHRTPVAAPPPTSTQALLLDIRSLVTRTLAPRSRLRHKLQGELYISSGATPLLFASWVMLAERILPVWRVRLLCRFVCAASNASHFTKEFSVVFAG
jgi:hypothetical protein